MVVSERGAAARAVVAAVAAVDGLRPALPVTPPAPAWLPWQPADGVVELTPGRVTVRVVACALPLPPLLAEAESEIRGALADSAWAAATLRLVVCEIDACAFDVGQVTPRDP